MILRCDSLAKSFGGNRAVDNVTLAIDRGEISAIIGPNGAGKTTLFHLITGYLPADGGRVWFRESEITHLPAHKISRVGVTRTFQGSNLFPRMTVFENVQVALFAQRGESASLRTSAGGLFRREVEEILGSVSLQDSSGKQADVLSGGNKRRLELAIAIAAGGELLLLDEPTAGIDPKETESMTRLIEGLARRRGLTVVFIEHDMEVVFAIAQKVRVMHRGAILAEGSPEEMRTDERVRDAYLGWGA